MRILERLIGIFAPHVCLRCGTEDNLLLCGDCRQSLAVVPSRCYRCKTPTDRYAVCAACAANTPLHRVIIRSQYRGVAKDLVHHLKFERAQAGAREISELLADSSPCLPSGIVLTHIPTASSRVRARGYDHARLIARSLAAETAVRHQTLLGRVGQARQVGASRAQRLQQLQGALRPLHPAAIRGRHIVLVDDVLTTGATLEAAAQVLICAGATRVSAIVFAQA